MPTKSYPITITTSPDDKILELDVDCTPDISHDVNLIIVNGTSIELSPYSYIAGATNTIRIVNLLSVNISVIFNHPTELWVNDFVISNPVLSNYTRENTAALEPVYRPLNNFLDPGATDLTDDRNYNSPFTTTSFGLSETSVIDLKLQPAYDGSVNMIWTDDSNPIRLVNSRFAVDEAGINADLVDRRARKDANTYNDANFHQTELIPNAVTVPTLTFNGVQEGGRLPGAGYRYFFKYVTADGAETDIIEESRLVSVHDGNTTQNAVGYIGEATSKAVSFSLSDLDQSFYGIVVYYTVASGEVDSAETAFKILNPFIIEDTGTCDILHTGYEGEELINIETLSLTYSVISRSKTLTVVNNRLLVGNTEATDIYDSDLAQAASTIAIYEGEFDVVHHQDIDDASVSSEENNYSNPSFIYDNMGYWKGETYELGIVYVTDEGLSPVYPLQGIDNIDGYLTGDDYEATLSGGLYKGYGPYGQNAMGVYRTEARTDLWSYSSPKLTFSGTNLSVNVSTLSTVADNITGFFFVRRKRKKDALVQGLLTTCAAVPIETKFGSEYEISGFGNWTGVGVESSVSKGNVKFVPAPGGIMPFGVEEVSYQSTVYEPFLTPSDTQVLTTGATSGSAVVQLTYVSGLAVGDQLQFLSTSGAVTAEIQSIASSTSTLTLTATATIPAASEVMISADGGSGVSTDFYTKAPIRDYANINSFAFYSPDLDCAPTYYSSIFSGRKVGVQCNKQSFSTDQVNATAAQTAPVGLLTPLYRRITGAIGSATALTGDTSAYTSFVDNGAMGVAPKGFSGSMDRNLYCYWAKPVGATALDDTYVISKINAATDQFSSGNPIGKKLAYRPGNAIAFGRYLGLRFEAIDGGDLPDLSMTESAAEKNLHAYVSLVGWLNGTTTETTSFGYVSTIFNSETGAPLELEAWKARYVSDEDTEYLAISPRFRTTDYFGDGATQSPTITLYGGDCFLGQAWKQVYHPLGITEAPQTNDITAYKKDRRSLGLLPYGFALPIPCQSNYNFNVRSKERVDDREYKVYGTDRSFLPLRGDDSIRGNRQFETSAYNHGYNAQGSSAFKQFRLNLNAPFYRFKYPNRVYVSSEYSENEFVNGFANFKGLNFRDYNTNLGAITKLIALNNVLISVYKDGVAQIGVDERSMLSQDTGGVFVDAAQVLSRANVINSDYGSSHLRSVCTSNNFVYGVDFTRLKIWRTNGKEFEIISDLKIQNKLGSISKELLAILAGDTTNRWIDIFSHFDSRKNEIYFTFVVRDPSDVAGENLTRTLVYSETIQQWVCETDDTRKFLFQSNESRYAFPSVVGQYNSLYKYAIDTQADVDPTVEVFGEYNKFYDTIYDTYFDYHVIDEQSLYKIYQNIYVVGNNSLPTSVTYTSDHNSLTTQELKPYTNINYPMVDTLGNPFTVTGVTGSQTLTITQTAPELHGIQSDLTYGHFISVVDPADAGILHKYVIIEYVPGSYITVDKELITDFTDQRLYFGYNFPMRISDSSFEESYGVITCQFNNRTANGHSPTKLRGKWMRFRHLYEGTAPVYISGIITDYGISLS